MKDQAERWDGVLKRTGPGCVTVGAEMCELLDIQTIYHPLQDSHKSWKVSL